MNFKQVQKQYAGRYVALKNEEAVVMDAASFLELTEKLRAEKLMTATGVLSPGITIRRIAPPRLKAIQEEE